MPKLSDYCTRLAQYFRFKSENGIDSKEEGHLKVVPLHDDTKDKKEGPTMGVVHVKSGQVTWTSPECITFTLR